MSQQRLHEFKKCSKQSIGLRKGANLAADAFTYHHKMTPSDACKVYEWLKSQKIVTVDQLLSRKGMVKAEKLMCRWPRPRELSFMTECMGYDQDPSALYYHRLSVKTDADDPKMVAKFVGRLGANFNAISDKHDLMYMWMHGKVLLMYARDEHKLFQAMQDAISIASKHGIKVFDDISNPLTKKFVLSPTAPDFIPAAKPTPKRLSVRAIDFNPKSPTPHKVRARA